MSVTLETFLLVVSILLFISCLSSGASFKFGVPAVLIFLAIGMLAGEDGFGIQFSNPKVAQFIGIMSLSFILFSGGLSTNWQNVRPVLKQGATLASLGVILSALILGLFIYMLIPGMNFTVSLLIGSIASSTDAAAVFSILRANNTNLRPRLLNTLEFESAANDPMAYLLTITMIGIINKEISSGFAVIGTLIQQIFFGLVVAVIMGRFMVFILNKVKLATAGLYPVMLMALNIFTYAITDKLGGNGFLSVYISGVILGNHMFMYKKNILGFFEGESNLWQIILFLTLGLLVVPHQITSIAHLGIGVALLLMFIARPLSVFICMSFFRKKNSWQEIAFISWVGIRGASSIVFATMPWVLVNGSAQLGFKGQIMIFNVVFFISIFSVLLQGTTLTKFAKWLNLEVKQKKQTKYSFVEIDGRQSSEMIRVELSDNSPVIGKTLMELNLPKSVLITTITRNDEYIIPRGNTQLYANDEIMIFASKLQDFETIKVVLGIQEEDND